MARLKRSYLSSDRWKWCAVTLIDAKQQDQHDQEKIKGHLPLFTRKTFDMSKRHNLSLQELFRLGYQQRTWQSFLLKGSKCFISSCVLRYANSYYTGHCLFRGVRRNFTAIICFASLAFAHLVQEEKN